MDQLVYLNGRLVEKSQALISPDDRGFNFADGIYEVIKYYRGIPFRYADHLERLKRSLREIRLDFDGCDQLEDVFRELVERNDLGGGEAGIYLQITRGSHPRIHQFPAHCIPTVYAYAFPFAANKDQQLKGISVITTEDIRWLRCDIKSVALLANVLAFQKAVDKGAGEAIFIRNGIVKEASHSSVMWVRNGAVCTHPGSNHVLPGITERVIMDICRQAEIPFVEEEITEADLKAADEVFIAGTGSEVTPVVNIDGTLIGDGLAGKLTRIVQGRFFDMVNGLGQK
ncbi:MAG: D-amino-acid transaminase [Prolixibacteraceae bacterium]